MADGSAVETLSFGQLLEKEFPPENFIIGDGLLAKNGMMFIAGPPKSYKSFVNNAVAYHLITSSNLFGAYRVHSRTSTPVFNIPNPQRILLLEQEIGFYDVRERLLPLYRSIPPEHQAKMDQNFFIHSRDHTMTLDTQQGFDRIRKIIEPIKPDVVMFDPLIEFHTSDENDSQRMGIVMKAISLLQEEFGFAVIVTHHMGKPDASSKKQGMDMLRGSSVVAGKLDTVLMLNPTNRSAGLIKIDSVIRRGRPLQPFTLKINWQTLKTEFFKWEKDPDFPSDVAISDSVAQVKM